MAIPRERLLPILESMLLMRRVEEATCTLGPKEVFGNYHVYFGQEATGASIIALLQPHDPIFSTHRCHAHALARGIPLEDVFGELLLRDTGASRGKGGTQHIMSRERRVVATSIVGSSTLLATGAAMAAQVTGEDWISVAFLGDRSLAEGVVPEVMNLAGLWDLPVLYVCENNNVSEGYTPRRSNLAMSELIDLPQAYGVTARAVDATDPNAVYAAAEELLVHVRAERRPAFLEARTPPWAGRSPGNPTLDVTGASDLRLAWEPPVDDPLAGWHQVDPLLRMITLVLDAGAATRDEILALDGRIQGAIAAATATALAAPVPTAANAYADILAGGELWPN